MNNRMKLTDGVTDVMLSPIGSFEIPNIYLEYTGRSLTGSYRYVYQNGSKRKWEFGITKVPSVDAASLNSWREADTELAFYPNFLTAPETSYNVKIRTKDAPLKSMMAPLYNTWWDGKLILEEY